MTCIRDWHLALWSHDFILFTFPGWSAWWQGSGYRVEFWVWGKKIIHSDMQLACTCVYVAWVKRRAGKISDENLKSVSPSKRIITQNDSRIFTVKFQHPYQSLIDLAWPWTQHTTQINTSTFLFVQHIQLLSSYCARKLHRCCPLRELPETDLTWCGRPPYPAGTVQHRMWDFP